MRQTPAAGAFIDGASHSDDVARMEFVGVIVGVVVIVGVIFGATWLAMRK
jgi:hypothetical protein